MHDCMRLSGIFFMLAIGGGSAEIKHLTRDAKQRARGKESRSKHGKHNISCTSEFCIYDEFRGRRYPTQDDDF